MAVIAVSLALFALGPSVMPGAFSVFGLLISLVALMISVLSVANAGKKYYRAVMAIIIFGLLMVNDGLRLWNPLELPVNDKLALYAIFIIVALVCTIIVNRIAQN